MKEIKILYTLTAVLIILAAIYLLRSADFSGFIVANETQDSAKTAVFATINLDPQDRKQESYYLELGKRLSEYTDLKFEFGGHLDIDYRHEIDLKRQLDEKFPYAYFMFAVLPELKVIDRDFEGGLYYFEGFATLNKDFDETVLRNVISRKLVG